MNEIQIKDIVKYVEENISTFHTNRLEALTSLKLEKILKRKNPYLFKAKNILTAHEFMQSVTDAYISSQEETIFGDFLEGLAIFVAKHVHGGEKSPAEGIDLGFEFENSFYLVSIKSGPNWANSQQKKRMIDNFRQAKRILGFKRNIICVNGCCYGRVREYDKGDYLLLCGQRFWELISNRSDFYTEIIEPLGHKAKERNDEFSINYSKMLNTFTGEFIQKFCLKDGAIDWVKVVHFNSGTECT